MKKHIPIFFILFLILTKSALCASIPKEDIPPDLLPWIPWVMQGQEEQRCPTLCNNAQAFQCAWPSELLIQAEKEEGNFSQEWTLYADAWIPLPGSADLWPQDVLLNGSPATVISRDQLPSLFLEAGEYRLSGLFRWKEIPEMLRIPGQTALLSLSIEGREIPFPVLDKSGNLWLRKRRTAKKREDRLEVRVFRKITDGIPMKILQRIQVDVSGQMREIRLPDVLLENAVPLSLSADFPVRMGAGREILAQVRPGKWEIRLETRFSKPPAQIGPLTGTYGQEVWVFEARNDLRLVEIEGPDAIDPSRTALPDEWKRLPAYLMDKGSLIRFKEIRRGNAEPAPDRLNLRRSWWLDFDGKGFTVRDEISGTMRRRPYLSMHPSAVLGRVSVNGRDQLITTYVGKAGVEIRQGNIRMIAESRLENAGSAISAGGWEHDFDSLGGTLHLPPGWKLFAQRGADAASGTWLRQWTLLDIFLILMISVASLKLRSPFWGAMALLCMMLIWQEKDAPRFVWLHILASFALLRLLPRGKIRSLVRLWAGVAVIVLLALSIPFMMQQIRWGMYPQLEYPWKQYDSSQKDIGLIGDVLMKTEAENVMQSAEEYVQTSRSPQKADNKAHTFPGQYQRKKAVFTHDPNASVQTGPGLPAWTWHSADIQWHGPVNRSQEIRFYFISPVVNLMLAVVRVLFLALCIYGLLNVRQWRRDRGQKLSTAGALIFLLGMLCGFSGMPPAHAGDFPSPELLNELQQRIMESEDCFQPSCAVYSRMDLSLAENADGRLHIRLEVHAAKATAVPLPGGFQSWTPRKIFLGEKEVRTIIRDASGKLWISVPQGIHYLHLQGPAGPGDEIHLPLPLKPYMASATVSGWDVQGIHADGKAEKAIQLTRQKKSEAAGEIRSDVLPPFLEVRRSLRLGVQWEAETRIRRLSPLGSPIFFSLPLLPGESVTTQGIHVKDRQARVSMTAEQKEIQWISALENTADLTLQAADTETWTEIWVMDASPVWHLEFSGIPPVHQQDAQGVWNPTWRPLPGERIRIRISRPPAIEGRTVTIDSAELKWTPGNRIADAQLRMRIRSAKGERHSITLPEGAELQQVKIGGESKSVRPEGRKLILPLKPGMQEMEVQWQQNRSLSFMEKGPELHIGSPAVNARVIFHMPSDRWILLAGGPRMGPAVLFWSYFFVILIAGFALGKIPLTPLTSWQWMLLGLGLTQIHVLGALLIIGWFLALGLRKKDRISERLPGWFLFNLMQICLAGLTLAAMICFYLAIQNGLLGTPEMQISGNGSGSAYLYWTQDRIDGSMPQPWAVSLPRFTYHLFMLFWSLWLATAMIRWLRWGWECFGHETLWKKAELRFRKKKGPPDLPNK